MKKNLNPNWSWEAAEEGMNRVSGAANPEWWRYMTALLIEVARSKPYLYTDDLEALRRERKGPETHEQRAIGPLMKAAKKAGIIRRTPHLISGRWDERVWASTLYQGARQSPPVVKRGRER